MITRSKNEFLDRLGIYMLGIAIGLVIVGLIWMARANAARARAAAENLPPSPAARP